MQAVALRLVYAMNESVPPTFPLTDVRALSGIDAGGGDAAQAPETPVTEP